MTEAINQELLHEYAEAFEMWDVEGEGFIPLEHIDHVLNALGQKVHHATLQSIQQRKKAEGDKTVSFEEFLYLLQTGGTSGDFEEAAGRDRSSKLKSALSLFDPSQSGTISVVDLRKALRDVMKDHEIEELLKKADTNGNGRIDCGFLAELMTGV